MWVDGLPVLDAFMAAHEPYPQAFRGNPFAGATPWLTAEQYFELLLATPPHEDWDERPDSSWSAVLGWKSRNPELVERYPATEITAMIASGVVQSKARQMLRSMTPPIIGTWRLSVILDGGPARTFHMRTRAHPMGEWRTSHAVREPVDPLAEPARPDAYSMIASVALSAGGLPTDCRRTRDIASEGYVYVIDPVTGEDERPAEWQGWLEVDLVASAFPGDSALDRFRRQAFDDWFARNRTGAEREAPARYRFAGGVMSVEQTIRLQDGRTLAVRGERISDDVIACDW
jgi:hypothetical protein